MKEFSLNGSLRTETGKKMAKQLRRQNSVPAVLYGGKEVIMLSLVERDLKDLIYTPDVYLVNLNIGKKTVKAIVKEMQFHPVVDKVLHVDFLEVEDNKKLTIALPVQLVGSAEGVKQGGKLTLINRKLRVNGFAKDLPEVIQIDISDLGLGKSRLVCDISGGKYDIVESKSTVIATVKLTRVARGIQAAEAQK